MSCEALERRPDFAGLLAALDVCGVRFVLVGGLAMVAHGSAYITYDVDIICAPQAANMARLAEALTPLHTAPGSTPSVGTLGLGQSATVDTAIGRLDVWRRDADTFEGLWRRADVLPIRGRPIHVACLDDLIAMKQAIGRHQDQLHLMELQALRKLTQTPSENGG